MTRPGNDTPRTQSGRSSAPRPRPTPGAGYNRQHGPVGRSTLWADQEARAAGPQPLKASWDPVERGPRPTTKPRPARTGRRRSAVGWFFHRYGWRAYAIPVLIALTIVVIVQIGRPPGPATVPAALPAASALTTVVSGVTTTMTVTASATPKPGSTPRTTVPGGAAASTPSSSSGLVGPVPTTALTNVSSFALPAGGAFVAKGKNTWHVVKGTSPAFGSGPDRFTFTIEVEDGIESAQSDQDFASVVMNALQDPRSWIGSKDYTFQRVDSGTPSFRISLTSQMTVRQDALCGWEIQFEASCYARSVQRVAINDARWARGAVSYNGDLGLYRVYAINHEVGHALGYMHQPCGTNNGLAPVMMQQSWSTADDSLSPLNPQLVPADGKVCKANPYPFPLIQTTSESSSAASG